jgi:hypothetical protein
MAATRAAAVVEGTTMSQHSHRVLRAIVVASIALLALTTGVAAREPVDPATLNPAPPPEFNATCDRLGNQIRCELAFSDPPFFDEPSGVVCGGVELLVSQTRAVVGKRFYQADGDLLRRHFRERFTGDFSNPVTGRSVVWVAHNTILHDLGVPGEIASGSTQITGQQIRIFADGGGTVLLDAGRIVIDEATGEILSSSGPKHFDDYFAFGDEHALDALCAAVA